MAWLRWAGGGKKVSQLTGNTGASVTQAFLSDGTNTYPATLIGGQLMIIVPDVITLTYMNNSIWAINSPKNGTVSLNGGTSVSFTGGTVYSLTGVGNSVNWVYDFT